LMNVVMGETKKATRLLVAYSVLP